MPRRTTKAGNAAIAFLIFIGLIIWGFSKLFETVGFLIPVLIVMVGIVAYFSYKAHLLKERTAYLRNKYHDGEAVQRILRKEIWQGETAEQLRDSIGSPAEADDAVLKTKKKEVWKYGQTGVNRFNLRVDRKSVV